MNFPLSELLSIERARADLGWPVLTFRLRNKERLTPLHFVGTPVKEFWHCLGRFIVLNR